MELEAVVEGLRGSLDGHQERGRACEGERAGLELRLQGLLEMYQGVVEGREAEDRNYQQLIHTLQS